MRRNLESLANRTNDPLVQAAIIVMLCFVFNAVAKIVNFLGFFRINDRQYWIFAATFLFTYIIFNSLLSTKASSLLKYWGRSIYSFLGSAVLLCLMAYLFSSMTMDEAGSFRWLLGILSLTYLVFMIIMTLSRKIIEFAEQEEWNKPRSRRNRP